MRPCSWLPFALAASLWAASPACAAPPAEFATFVLATANLSDNTTQTYEDSGIRILQALKPDVVGIQEFSTRRGSLEEWVLEIFGPGFHFHREPNVRLPNGIVSRFPIVDSGQWDDPYVFDRRFVWATLDVPGPVPLHVVSVHLLKSQPHNRRQQAILLLRQIRDRFPSGDYVALCGDFNVDSRDSDALAELTAWFVDSPQPADQEGNPNTNLSRSRPYDFVLVSPSLAPFHVPTLLGGLAFPNGLVFDTRIWNPPPPPARWEDTSGNLQHLPVVKTFRIPL